LMPAACAPALMTRLASIQSVQPDGTISDSLTALPDGVSTNPSPLRSR
jgi:hypothetical protein